MQHASMNINMKNKKWALKEVIIYFMFKFKSSKDAMHQKFKRIRTEEYIVGLHSI